MVGAEISKLPGYTQQGMNPINVKHHEQFKIRNWVCKCDFVRVSVCECVWCLSCVKSLMLSAACQDYPPDQLIKCINCQTKNITNINIHRFIQNASKNHSLMYIQTEEKTPPQTNPTYKKITNTHQSENERATKKEKKGSKEGEKKKKSKRLPLAC